MEFHRVFLGCGGSPAGVRRLQSHRPPNMSKSKAPDPYSPPAATKSALDELYGKYNRRDLVHPDPLEFLYLYDDPLDREIVGIVASSLAYGRVQQILRSVSTALDRMGPSPAQFVLDGDKRRFKKTFADFKHRFTTGEGLAALMSGMRRGLKRHGSLEACFMASFRKEHPTVIPALTAFVDELNEGAPEGGFALLPSPRAGSACKRLNLFLRWMVRRDKVDPGGWASVPRSRLVVPLDTHMHRIGLMMGLTERKQAGMRTALEITNAFRAIAPRDPVRYDFALTRLGIRDDAELY